MKTKSSLIGSKERTHTFLWQSGCLTALPLIFTITIGVVSVLGVNPVAANPVTVIGTAGTPGTNGVNPGDSGGPGGAGSTANSVAGPNADLGNTATATGGDGGSGGIGGDNGYSGAGGDGGAATATATTSVSNGSATATATGGNGGASFRSYPSNQVPGLGGSGGAATATATTSVTDGSATAVSAAYGGGGGAGIPLPACYCYGGGGGTAMATSSASTGDASPVQSTATATGGTGRAGLDSRGLDGASLTNAATASGISQGGTVNVTASVRGGDGGVGYQITPDAGPPGSGNGGAASLINAVSGSTTGSLILNQSAVGGNGAGTYGWAPGGGGDAISSLTYVDGAASSLSGNSSAIGGSGGTGGPGAFIIQGNANANIALTSTLAGTNVNANATATTPYSFFGYTTANAKASATAVGTGIANAKANAIGYYSPPISFNPGWNSGGANATSQSNAAGGQSVSTSATSLVGTYVNGPTQAITQSVIGGSGLGSATINAGQALSYINGLPSSPTLTANVAAAFTGSVYGVGSMGIGAGDAASSGSLLSYQTSANFVFNYETNAHFVLGLMSNQSLGDGFNSSSLDIYLNGVLMSDNQFTSLASAQAFFTDNPIAFGSWGDGLADIGIIFSLTSDQPNSGFAFDYAIGTTTPLPAALPLFATGLGALGLLGWRRKRKALAA